VFGVRQALFLVQFRAPGKLARLPADACPLSQQLLTQGSDVDGGLGVSWPGAGGRGTHAVSAGRPRPLACGAVHYFGHVNILRWF
jgi:hypothetical protein